MDIFTEQLVTKPANSKDTTLKILIGAAAALICAICVYLMLFGWAILLVVACGAVYGAYYLISGLNVEYEYIVTNGEMDIDKIMGKRKRKRLITVKASAFERFGKLIDAPETESGTTIIMANGINSSDEPTEEYYAELNHSAYGNVRIIFTPEQKVIDSLKPFFKGELKKSMYMQR